MKELKWHTGDMIYLPEDIWDLTLKDLASYNRAKVRDDLMLSQGFDYETATRVVWLASGIVDAQRVANPETRLPRKRRAAR